MIYDVRLSPAAERDLERLAAFLIGKSPRAAMRSVEIIEAALGTLEQHPDRGRPGPRRGRREIVARFGRDGYVIQYRVDDGVVVVARIKHSREAR